MGMKTNGGKCKHFFVKDGKCDWQHRCNVCREELNIDMVFEYQEHIRELEAKLAAQLAEISALRGEILSCPDCAQAWIPVSEEMPDVGRLIHTFESFGELNATDNIHLLDLDAGGIYRTRIFNNDYRADSLGCGESLWMYARPLPTAPEDK